MLSMFNRAVALVSFLALSALGCAALAVPITNGGPGGVGKTDGTTSLAVWVRSDQGLFQDTGGTTPTTTAGQDVDLWKDLSGYGNDFSLQTVDSPTLSASTVNGQPMVNFDNSPLTVLRTPNFGLTHDTNNPVHIFSSFRNNSGDGTNPTVFSAAGNNLRLFTNAGNLNSFFMWAGTSNLSGTVSTATSNHNYAMLWRESSSQMRQDGGTIASGGGATATTPGFMELGGLSTQAMNSDISEFILHTTQLDSVQINLIENYQSARTAIAMSVPADDHYSGDTAYDYDLDVFGVGNDGSNSVTNGGMAGFGIEADGGSLGANEWVLAGHDQPTNSLTTNDVTGAASHRWSRDWYVDKDGAVDATLSFDFSDAGLTMPSEIEGFALLFRSSAGGSFSDITSLALSTTVSGDTISFALLDANLSAGFYTLGIVLPVPEPSALTLLGLGMLGMMVRTRRRTRIKARLL